MVKEFGKSALKWVLLLSMIVAAVNIQIGMASAEGEKTTDQHRRTNNRSFNSPSISSQQLIQQINCLKTS